MLKIAICDDEIDVCKQITAAVKVYESIHSVPVNAIEFTSGEELMKYIASDRSVDIIFLDILLKLENGVEIAGHIRDALNNQTVQIVYVSGIGAFSQEMFESRPMNFLTKPVSEDKIIAEIEKYVKLSKHGSRNFSYKIGGELCNRTLDEIIYFESVGRQIKIVCVDGTEYFYGKMKSIFDELNMDGFNYIHRSYIVNTKHIAKYARTRVIMSNKDELPVSKSMSHELKVSFIR